MVLKAWQLTGCYPRKTNPDGASEKISSPAGKGVNATERSRGASDFGFAFPWSLGKLGFHQSSAAVIKQSLQSQQRAGVVTDIVEDFNNKGNAYVL